MARTVAELPGPPGVPLLGNVHQLMRRDRLHSTLEAWCDQYGPIIRVKIPGRPMIAIADPDAINAILRERPEGFRRWAEQSRLQDEMGGAGIFAAEGEDWKRQRRALDAALNARHLQRYYKVISASLERLHRRLSAIAESGQPHDIEELLGSYTVDNTAALVFGHDLNTLEGDNDLHKHTDLIFRMLTRRLGAPVPYWRWFKLPSDRKLDRTLAHMRPVISDFVHQARRRIAERPELLDAPDNVLEGMIAAQHADGRFTDEEISANVFTLLLAGEETTAHTLGWTIWFLATHRDVQTRAAAEADHALHGRLLPSDPADVDQLPYAEAVMREAIRLKTAVPIQPVEPLTDTTICGTHVPRETRLVLLLRPAGLRTCEQPQTFEPSLWLGDSDGPKTLAFGAGPRFCPGRGLAFLEIKPAIAMIARNFEVTLDESNGPVTERLNFSMKAQGLSVRLRART